MKMAYCVLKNFQLFPVFHWFDIEKEKKNIIKLQF